MALPPAQSVVDAEWSAPANLGPAINSSSNEQNATLSRDGLSLYLTSDRPGGFGGLDIWVSNRASLESSWNTAVNLGPTINTSGADFAPNLSTDGHLLFFASVRAGGLGNSDVYLSQRSDVQNDFGWGSPTLVAGVSSPDFDNAPMYRETVEESPVNFYFNRGVLALNQGEIYSAGLQRDGEVSSPPMPVVELNAPGANDAAPSVRRDGKEVFFFSNRIGTAGAADIWTSTRASVHSPWSEPVNVGTSVNSAAGDVTPSLSFDGRILIFGSSRPGGIGGNDIWMSTRFWPAQ